MPKKDNEKQMRLFSATLEELMPKEHFLRDPDRIADFDFIYEKVKDMYSKTGCPSIDSVVLKKMLLIGYLYGIDLPSLPSSIIAYFPLFVDGKCDACQQHRYDTTPTEGLLTALSLPYGTR